MKFRLISPAVLATTIAISSFYLSPSSTHAESLCKTIWQHLNPFKQCYSTDFVNAPMPTDYVPFSKVSAVEKQDVLVIRPFDGKEFGSLSAIHILSGGTPFRAYSWDGATASYITVDSQGRSILTIRPFDGIEFGPVSSTQVFSNGDVYHGWGWFKGKAVYVVKSPKS